VNNVNVKYFITPWLHREDSKNIITECSKIMKEIVSKYGNVTEEVKTSSTGRRLTIAGLCDVKEGQNARDVIDRISQEISEKTKRVAKGKALKT
jgi:predicted Co/Zn/Cd cation transporter (cation efflux family)